MGSVPPRVRTLFRKGVVRVVVSLIVVIVAIMIGAMIVGQIQSMVSTLGLPTNATTVINRLISQTWSSYNLLTILPLILIAATIISVLVGVFVARREVE